MKGSVAVRKKCKFQHNSSKQQLQRIDTDRSLFEFPKHRRNAIPVFLWARLHQVASTSASSPELQIFPLLHFLRLEGVRLNVITVIF